MYRKCLLAVLFLATSLWGEIVAPGTTAVDPLGLVHGCVSVLTGDYIETQPDVVVNCHEPIALWRVHVSDGSNEKVHSRWRIGQDKIETDIWNKKGRNGHLFYRVDETGSVVRFRVDPIPKKWSLKARGKPHWQALPEASGYCNTSSGELSGRTHLLNDHLLYDSRAETFTLTRGNGEQRLYRHHGKWTKKGALKKFIGFCGETYDGRPRGKHETFLLASIRRPNGNRVFYLYDKDGRLTSIRSANADNTVTFGIIWIQYNDHNTVVTTSDGQKVTYTPDNNRSERPLHHISRNGQPVATFGYHVRSRKNNYMALSDIYRPEGRTRHIEYYYTGNQHPYQERAYVHDWDFRRGRVSSICEATGEGGALERLYAFYYGFAKRKWGIENLGWIDVFDAHGHRTRYTTDNDRLVEVTTYDDGRPIKTIRQTWADSDLVCRSTVGGHTRTFTYDKAHNVLTEAVDGITLRTCTYTHFNLLASETTGDLRTTYTYLPNTDLLAHKQTYDRDTLISEEHFTYDHNAALIHHEIHSGPQHLITRITRRSDGLPLLIEELTTTHLTYDDHHRLIEQRIDDKTTTTTYDPHYRIASQTNPLGHTTTYTYDANNNITALTTPTRTTYTTYDCANRPTSTALLDRTTQTTYDPHGRLLTTTTPDGDITTHTYDPLGRLQTSTAPDGGTTTYVYDANNNLIAETNPLGHTTHTTYNHLDQPLTIAYPDGTRESFTYTPTGHLLSHTARNGLTTTYTRDALGRETSATTPHSQTHTTYTGNFLTSHTDPLNLHTTYTYDTAGRLILETTPETSIAYTYDTHSRLTSTLENDLRLTTFTYDPLDRLTSEQTHTLTTYTYDPDSNLLTTTTGPSTTTHTYDAHSRLLSTTDPCGHTTTYTHAPHLLITTHPNQTTTHTHTDHAGRPLLIEKHSDHLLSRTAYTYDLAGNLLTEDHSRIQNSQTLNHYILTCTYDPAGRLLTLLENDTRLTTHIYNSLGQLTQTTHPDSTTHHFTYDSSGRLATDPLYAYTYDAASNILTAGKTTRTYDAYSRLTSETLANGLRLTYTYDSFHRPTSITLPDSTQTLYTYDAYHLRTLTRPTYTHHYLAYNHLSEPTTETLPLDRGTRTSTYDPMGRLLTLTTPLTTLTYTYNSMGNLTTSNDTTYTYPPLNQLEPSDSLHNPPEADALNQLPIPHTPRGCPAQYTYDTFNRLIQAGDTTYTYDAFHRRMSSNDTLYLWTDLNEIGAVEHGQIIQYRPLGLTPNAEIASAPAFELNNIPHLPIYDHRGCVIYLDDTPITYTTWGTPSATPSPWLFCSKRYDPETTLTYFGYRYYSSATRRWLTPDPLGHTSGPNLYAYCSNNPLSLLDPYGLFSNTVGELSAMQSAPRYGIELKQSLSHNPRTITIAQAHARQVHIDSLDPRGPQAVHLRNPFPDRPPLPCGQVIYINGQCNTYEQALDTGRRISDLMGGYQIEMIVVPTQGPATDTELSKLALYGHVCPLPVRLIREAQGQFFEDPNRHGKSLLMGHSQANIFIRNALIGTPKGYRDDTWVTGISPAGYVWSELAARVVNIRNPWDVVTMLDPAGKARSRSTIVDVSSCKCWPLSMGDHSVLSPTFRREIEFRLDEFKADQGIE